MDETIASGQPRASLLDKMAAELLRSRYEREAPVGGRSSIPMDEEWARQAFFLVPTANGQTPLTAADKRVRRFSTAELKYTDSSLGGNIAINAPPQFTKYADPPSVGIFGRNNPFIPGADGVERDFGTNMILVRNQSYSAFTSGQGHYYSYAIDDNSQIIHMRFGIPTYNSMVQFATGFYSSGLATAARAGRFTDGFHNVLTSVGNLIGLAVAPLFIVPILILGAASFVKSILGIPSTKFYYMKPTMPMYWTAVSTVVNQMTTLMGLTSPFSTRQSKDIAASGNGISDDEMTIQSLVSQYIQDEWLSETGVVDVRRIASRAKRLQQRFNLRLDELLNRATEKDNYEDIVLEAFRQTRQAGRRVDEEFLTPEDYLARWMGTYSKEESTTDPSKTPNEQDFRAKPVLQRDDKGTVISRTVGEIKDFASKLGEFYVAEVADGSDWVSFRVDYTGSVSESVSNNTVPSSLASTLNSISSKFKDIRHSAMDGNFVPGLGDVISGIQSVVSGAAEVWGLDGIASLAGSAFVHIDDNWESSVAQLPSADYTLTLISPHGNAISRLTNIYIPLACLIAGAFPLATGAQSHTSPFLCQLHDRGRVFIRNGMISRLQIRRGTSNLGFNNQGKAMAIEVSFSVKDLSPMLAVPITQQGFSILNPLAGVFDDQNSFQDYMMTLAGVTLPDLIYPISMMKYRANQKIVDATTYFSATNMASKLSTFPGSGILNGIFTGTNRE